MKCPECKNNFKLTWRQYVKAPFGRFHCPLCHTRLIGKPRWFFWLLSLPLMLGCYIVGILCLAYSDIISGIVVFIIGCSLVGLLTDKYLESRFCKLEIDEKYSSNKVESGDAEKPNLSS